MLKNFLGLKILTSANPEQKFYLKIEDIFPMSHDFGHSGKSQKFEYFHNAEQLQIGNIEVGVIHE